MKLLSLRLLSAAAFVPLASADYETVFTFKKDFFLRFCGLTVGMGPDDGEALLAGLNDQTDAFKEVWKEEIEKLQDKKCKVVGDVPTPIFSYCDWKYPDRYDTDLLPIAGQCHEHGGEIAGGGECYNQRLFYNMVDLRVRCPEKLPMEELNQSELLEAALVEMIPAANINPVTDPEGPWEEAFGVEEVESNEECNALLSINRYTKIDVDLKCLKEVITTDKADMLKDALDEYFEENVVPEIVDAVEDKTPESAVYSVKSPYDQDGDTVFCYYDSYYNDGTLVDQFEAGDGNTVTKFKCGFDIVWFKDKGFSDSLLPDLVETVQNFFIADDPSFLTFLQAKYNETTWVQTTQECGVVDPNILDPATPNPTTPNPTTASPTAEPTENPTKAPTTSPTQKPTAAPTGSPSISSSESPSNIPTTSVGPTAPTDTSSPTQSPTTAAPTNSPTNSPTSSPTSAPTSSPTAVPTSNPTASPTSNPTNVPTKSPFGLTILTDPPVNECIISTNVTEEESPYVTDGLGKCGGGFVNDGICAEAGYCCSQWGWCGTTADYCDDVAPTTTPIDPNAGKCGTGDGIIGDGTCTGENECCSAWGYCGEGDQYCSVTIDTRTNESSEGKCGGGGVGEGECFNGGCCSEYGFCGFTDDYCTGVQPRDDDTGNTDTNPLIPNQFQPTMGYRCGRTETDARSNCKKTCTHARGDNNGLGPCADDEECWGVQLNYCNTFDEGTHPICTDLDRANTVSRCGLDEASARGHCGQTCDTNDECPGVELCFDVMENLCDCHWDLLGSIGVMPLPDWNGTDVNDTVVEPKDPQPIYNQEAPEDGSTGFPTPGPSPASDGSASSGDQGTVTDDELSGLPRNPFALAKSKIQPYFVKSVGEGSVEGLSRDNASFQVNMSVAVVAIVSLNALFSYFM